jgi:hypothetical protein
MEKYKHKQRVRGKDKIKNKFNKFGKNTSKGQRIKSSKINNVNKKNSKILLSNCSPD